MLRFVIGHQEGGENIEQTDTLTRQLLYNLARCSQQAAQLSPYPLVLSVTEIAERVRQGRLHSSKL